MVQHEELHPSSIAFFRRTAVMLKTNKIRDRPKERRILNCQIHGNLRHYKQILVVHTDHKNTQQAKRDIPHFGVFFRSIYTAKVTFLEKPNNRQERQAIDITENTELYPPLNPSALTQKRAKSALRVIPHFGVFSRSIYG